MNNINYFKSLGLILITGNMIFATKLPFLCKAFQLKNSEMKLFESLVRNVIPSGELQQVDKTAYNYDINEIFKNQDINEFIDKFERIYSSWQLDIETLVDEYKTLVDQNKPRNESHIEQLRNIWERVRDSLPRISCSTTSGKEATMMQGKEIEKGEILVGSLSSITYRATSIEGMMRIDEEIEQNLNGYFKLLTHKASENLNPLRNNIEEIVTHQKYLFRYINQIVQHIIQNYNTSYGTQKIERASDDNLENDLKEVFKNLIDLFNADKLNKNMELIAKFTFQLIEIPILFIYSRAQKELSIVDEIMKTICSAYTAVCLESKNFNSFEASKFLNAPDPAQLFLSWPAQDEITKHTSQC